jgi:NADPH:quinone reductase-like Zn-dependent oxidoreductase
MIAVRFHQHGAPDVLPYEEAPDPDLAPGDVLVRVRACALNHLDLWARRGLPNIRIPMPHIAGSDIAGEVIGSEATDVAIGRRVMLQLKRLTNRRGVDVVIEHVGEATWPKSVRPLAGPGRTAGHLRRDDRPAWHIGPGRTVSKQLTIHGS